MKFILLLIITRDVFEYGALLISANSLNMENHKNILGGKVMCKNHPHTHQISLHYINQHICGGSIISSRTVLTAAHCLINKYLNFLYIVAGITNLTDVGQKYSVKTIYIHASYDNKIYVNDIGLMITKYEIVFGARVRPIHLCKRKIEARKSCVTSGWGTNKLNGPPSHTLQELITFTITAEECTYRQPNRTPVIDDELQICVIRGVGRSVCQGDSGGPLVYEDQLIGITSWGRNCGIGFPDVFTSIYGYIGWIQKRKQ